MKQKVFQLESEADLSKLVNAFSAVLNKKNVIALKGPMGVGKTHFVKAWLAGDKEVDVSSPTFAIHNEYKTTNQIVDHFDLFRVESNEDLESTGIWDLFEKLEGLIFIEWPERMNLDHIPRDWNRIELRFEFIDTDDRKRKVTLCHD